MLGMAAAALRAFDSLRAQGPPGRRPGRRNRRSQPNSGTGFKKARLRLGLSLGTVLAGFTCILNAVYTMRQSMLALIDKGITAIILGQRTHAGGPF
jgi:hypothetical protein